MLWFCNLSLVSASVDEEHNDGDFIMHHVMDSHEWHIVTIDDIHVVIPLPIIIVSQDRGIECFLSSNFYDSQHKMTVYNGYIMNDDVIESLDGSRTFYDLSITKNVAAMLLSMVLMLFLFIGSANWYKKHSFKDVPDKGNCLLEMLILYIRDDVAIPTIGEDKYKKFMPYLLSVFFFIWINNMLGLLPASANVTGCFTITMCLAIFTFIITSINGTAHYWKHTFIPPVPKALLPIMTPIEVIGLFTKPFTLMVRLFANITSGHIILLSIINIVFVLHSNYVGIGAVALGTFMMMLKLIVAFLQAYIFTLLSSIYFGMATAEH
jgi:F-type H+-transporting ATPase subunit a